MHLKYTIIISVRDCCIYKIILFNFQSTPRYRSQSSASSQGSFVDPEGSVGFRKDLAQIVTCDTTDKEDSKMESFHPQQRRETGGNAKMLIQGDSVNMLDFLRIPKKKQGETLDSKCDDSRRLSQNSTDADFYGSSHGSLPDSMESTEQTTLDEQLSLRHDGSHMQHDKETSMEDSGSTQTSSTTLVTGETLTSLSSTSSTQYLQHSLSSLSVSIAMSPATPTHDEQLSLRHCSSHGKMESFQPQQRRETGGNAKMLIQDGSVNILRIPRNPPSNFDTFTQELSTSMYNNYRSVFVTKSLFWY